MSDRIAIVGGARTPFVRANGVFKDLPASTLAGVPLKETVARNDIDPSLIEEIYMGIVSSPPEGTNVSREALFDSGLPATIPCTTINRYCASACEAIGAVSAKIDSGQISIGLAGGVESISSVQALFSKDATQFFSGLAKAKTPGQQLGKLGQFKTKYLMPHAPGIQEPTTGLSMGQSADLMAREFKITRPEQDEYAYQSHMKAHRGWEEGFYQSHVVPVSTPQGKVIDKDTDIRSDTTIDKLATLKPVFYRDHGTITAGNASPLTDGAAAVLITRESRAKELGLPVLGYLRSIASAAVDIKTNPLLIGPVYAIPRALKKAGITWNDIDLVEMHEAFAAQVLSTIRAIESDDFAQEKLGLSQAIGKVDRDRLNLFGGSIPLGHPFGATGARMMLQTLHVLRTRQKNLGLISVCAAGGLGTVMVVEAAGS